MNDEEIFIPIASRYLVFVDANERRTELYVAIGAPYFPARLEGMEQMAACQVLTCDDPTLTTEIFGADEMEALMAGLEFLEFFLINVVRESGGGRLTLRDGSSFDPAGSVLLQESRRLAVKKVRQG